MGKVSSLEGCISIGPWGQKVGEHWAYKTEGRITRIVIRTGGAVDSLLFQSETSDGSPEYSYRFGGPGVSSNTDTVNMDYPSEHLTAIDLTFGNFHGQSVITSLCFHTNMTQYGPFGNKMSESLSIPMEDGIIVGFHGYADQYLNAIGIYAKPKNTQGQEYDATQHQMANSMKLAMPRDPGPWGGPGGKQWDHGVFSAVHRVFVHVLTVPRGVQFGYVKGNGEQVALQSHGRLVGDIKTITVDGKNEFFVGIDGFYGPVQGKNSCEAIASISFYTNKRQYGPFGGEEIGTYFTSNLSGGKIVGFFGRSGSYLNAIGVHMEYS